MSQLKEFWSNLQNVENASPEDIQKDVLAYLEHTEQLQAELTKEREAKGLLIEEREQLKAENARLKTCQSCGGQGFVELSHDPYYSEPCECVVFDQVLEEYPKLKVKVAEQDKEIQQFKTNAEYLQNVIDAKDEMLAWAERLVGSGPVPGMHYDPTNWLKEYRSTEYLERHTK